VEFVPCPFNEHRRLRIARHRTNRARSQPRLELRAVLEDSAAALAVPVRRFATVGHDAAVFQRAGVPAAMVLVRNAHGSHNPDEAMTLDDFGAGCAVLAAAIARLAAE